MEKIIVENPFIFIERRFNHLENLLLEIKETQKTSANPTNQTERLTIAQLSEQYKISKPTIHNLMSAGKIPYEKIGRKTLFKKSDVEAYFASNRKHLNKKNA